jgi:hypothetical protein
VKQREKNIHAATDAEDENLRLLQEMIRQGRRRLIKKSEPLKPAVESRDHSEPVAVGENAELRGWLPMKVMLEADRLSYSFKDGKCLGFGDGDRSISAPGSLDL